MTEQVIKFLTVRTDEEQKRLDKVKALRDAKKKVRRRSLRLRHLRRWRQKRLLLRRRKLRQRRNRALDLRSRVVFAKCTVKSF